MGEITCNVVAFCEVQYGVCGGGVSVDRDVSVFWESVMVCVTLSCCCTTKFHGPSSTIAASSRLPVWTSDTLIHVQ